MLGIIIALIVSWIVLYLFEKESILCLGFLPISKRAKQLIIGFCITAVLCVFTQISVMLLKGSSFHLSTNYSLNLLASMFWWDLRSVLTEELVFRGALLFVLIERLGMKTGVLISAAAFGIYHWFSMGVFGNIFPMIIVFIGTGLMGYAWALAFAKTNSIFLPIGLHLGWNFTFNTIFSKGPLGQGLLTETGGSLISDWFSLIGLWVVPLVVLLIIKYWIPTELTEQLNLKTNTSANTSNVH
ncbi:CPBP family intramembrane metalloprotease [Pontibacter sp. JH31]|uniref:CPBP family intramembrane metalloprotease n=1 Tax=Pontibacter aquaedesilientis TaxID=2766980 RepID=A0ABR7XHG4_9BACT|nr:type II CAAX endopeptidase family protein [Pontibacter aquaedesilientis]MBD1397744.1 CPBP family intramembrane metalloprotease [Pontibacter aquaedesilientis]